MFVARRTDAGHPAAHAANRSLRPRLEDRRRAVKNVPGQWQRSAPGRAGRRAAVTSPGTRSVRSRRIRPRPRTRHAHSDPRHLLEGELAHVGPRVAELHLVEPPGRLDRLRERFGSQLRISPYLGSFYLGYNLRRAPFADQPKLRRALSLAITPA
jgi:oligopeptide transport system substrate-binding protein